MPKHNYSQYSNKNKPTNNNKAPSADTATAVSNTVQSFEPAIVPDKAVSVSEVKMGVETVNADIKLVKESVDTVSLPKTVTGVVVDCLKLNVREEPDIDADVVCVLDVMSEVKIDVAKSTRDWFKIYTAIGAEGYCMRKFVDAYL